MRTYAEACQLADDVDGRRIPFVTPGRGSTQYVTLRREGHAIAARVVDADVVVFHPDRVEISTGGWVTRTTGEGIDAALDVRGAFATWHRVPYVLGHRMTEPTVLDYAGNRLPVPSWAPHEDDWLNQRLTPLADWRRADLDVVGIIDARAESGGYRVTVRDWTYDGRDHTDTARHLAAAYVGRRTARTRVVRRDHYPTREEPLVTILVKTEA